MKIVGSPVRIETWQPIDALPAGNSIDTGQNINASGPDHFRSLVFDRACDSPCFCVGFHPSRLCLLHPIWDRTIFVPQFEHSTIWVFLIWCQQVSECRTIRAPSPF